MKTLLAKMWADIKLTPERWRRTSWSGRVIAMTITIFVGAYSGSLYATMRQQATQFYPARIWTADNVRPGASRVVMEEGDLLIDHLPFDVNEGFEGVRFDRSRMELSVKTPRGVVILPSSRILSYEPRR